ncbi:hypothetical protein BsWGS_08540 [Bradybaena similaris]
MHYNKSLSSPWYDLDLTVTPLISNTKITVHAAHTAWSYEDNAKNGPNNWHVSYPDCQGPMQSPIDINTSKVLLDPSLQEFNLSEYFITDGVDTKLENVGGHTAEVTFSGRSLYLSGGSLPARYKLEQLHFHWGQNDTHGSEHTINNHSSPMELHVVHRQERFSSVGAAAPSPFGLAVLSFLFKIGRHNANYSQLIDYLQSIPNPDDDVELPDLHLADLIPHQFDYYRYHGSLTTPPCYESVFWSISLQHIEISALQLAQFRSLYKEGHQKLLNDFRPIQPLNHRTVFGSRRQRSFWNFPG